MPTHTAHSTVTRKTIMQKYLYALAASFTIASGAAAQIDITAPWVRATVPAQKSTGAFMHIKAAQDARLVAVSSPVATIVEMHQMSMDGPTMKMGEVETIDLPAGKVVNMASGGYHIMLIDLKRQLKDGDSVPLVLVVEYKNKKRETLTLKAPVKPLTFVSPTSAKAAAH